MIGYQEQALIAVNAGYQENRLESFIPTTSTPYTRHACPTMIEQIVSSIVLVHI